MVYDARQIANWFVSRAKRDGRALSIMSLLKLTYIAHGWHLELHGEPLFGNIIQAWQYGPVIPDVYNAFRAQGINVRETVPDRSSSAISEEDTALLEQVWTIYGSLSPFRLSDLTHVIGGPWDIATKTGGYYAPIPDELIQQHYRVLKLQSERRA